MPATCNVVALAPIAMSFKTGFHYGQTSDGWMWLRNPEGSFKKVDALIIDTLMQLNAQGIGWRDQQAMLPVPQVKALDILESEGYLRNNQPVIESELPQDIRLLPRLLLFVCLCIALGAAVYDRFDIISSRTFDPWVYFLLVPFCFFATVLHELGHYWASRPYFKPKFRFAMLHNIFPSFVVLTGDAWACPKNVRIWISLAGPLVDLVLGVIIAIIHLVYFPENTLLSSLLFIQLVRVLFVLNPLIEGDGYWCLCDALGIVNLRSRGVRELKQLRFNTYSIYLLLSYLYLFLSVLLIAAFVAVVAFSWQPVS